MRDRCMCGDSYCLRCHPEMRGWDKIHLRQSVGAPTECGFESDEMTWTTHLFAVTCPDCLHEEMLTRRGEAEEQESAGRGPDREDY